MGGLILHVVREHVLLGGVAAAGVWAWQGPRPAALFWLANVLIDADHYLHFLWAVRFREWTPQAMFRYHQEIFERAGREEFYTVEAFHTVEFVLLSSGVAWLLFPVLWPAVFGGLFHIVVDWVHLARHGLLDKRANSLFTYYRAVGGTRRPLQPAHPPMVATRRS